MRTAMRVCAKVETRKVGNAFAQSSAAFDVSAHALVRDRLAPAHAAVARADTLRIVCE